MVTNSSPEWLAFNKKHKDSGKSIEIDGKRMYQWSCSCGASEILSHNSGLPLGLKVQWRKHFEELLKRNEI